MNMNFNEINPYTFTALRQRLGLHRRNDERPMWQQRLSADSDFCRAVVANGYLTVEQMQRAVQRYRLGRSRDGGVIFWQIDQLGHIFDGKIMHYLPDCHRDHNRKPYWVSSALKRYYLKGYEQLAAEIPSCHCLFGTHLLGNEKQNMKNEKLAVAVVEAEKTAVILSEHFPNHLWLAAGGLNELTAEKLFPLRQHRVILFPDTDENNAAYTLWYDIAQKAMRQNGGTITVSSLLEQQATKDQKRRKIDLVDFLYEERRTITLTKTKTKNENLNEKALKPPFG